MDWFLDFFLYANTHTHTHTHTRTHTHRWYPAKGPYSPCLRMAGRALLAGYSRYVARYTTRIHTIRILLWYVVVCHTIWPISFRITSLSLGQLQDWSNASEYPWRIWVNIDMNPIMTYDKTSIKQSNTNTCVKYTGLHTVQISSNSAFSVAKNDNYHAVFSLLISD